MAISISTKPKLQTPQEAKAHNKLKKKVAFFQQRAEIDQQFKDIEDQKHIADSVAAGRLLGKLSAQEIIDAHEEFHGKILGERQRKYIVASLIAKHGLTFGKAAGANNYNDDVFNYILERMMEGESLRHICEDPYMPAKSVFFMWLQKDPSLNDRYTRAREIRKEVMEDDLQYHSEKPLLTPVVTLHPDGTQTIQIVDNIQRAKLITDSLKWRLSKMDPDRFGNAVGGDGGGGGQNSNQVEVIGGLPTNPLGNAPVFIDDPEHPSNLSFIRGRCRRSNGAPATKYLGVGGAGARLTISRSLLGIASPKARRSASSCLTTRFRPKSMQNSKKR